MLLWRFTPVAPLADHGIGISCQQGYCWTILILETKKFEFFVQIYLKEYYFASKGLHLPTTVYSLWYISKDVFRKCFYSTRNTFLVFLLDYYGNTCYLEAFCVPCWASKRVICCSLLLLFLQVHSCIRILWL